MSKAEWDKRYVDETLEVVVGRFGFSEAPVSNSAASDKVNSHGSEEILILIKNNKSQLNNKNRNACDTKVSPLLSSFPSCKFSVLFFKVYTLPQ